MSSALNSAVHHNIYSVAYCVDYFGKLVECRSRTIELSPAMVRQDDAGATYLDCAFCIRHRHNALQAKLTIPDFDHFGHVVPSHRRVEHFREVTSDRHRSAAHVDMLIQLRHFESFMGQVVNRPHRFNRELKHSAKCEPKRNGKTGAQIALTIAAGDAVNRQHHDVNAGLFGALHHGVIEGPIFMEIELVNL